MSLITIRSARGGYMIRQEPDPADFTAMLGMAIFDRMGMTSGPQPDYGWHVASSLEQALEIVRRLLVTPVPEVFRDEAG